MSMIITMELERAKAWLNERGWTAQEQDIPGLYRINNGPEISTLQLINMVNEERNREQHLGWGSRSAIGVPAFRP